MTIDRVIVAFCLAAALAACGADVPPSPPHPFGGTSPSLVPGARSNGG